jgi:hypothetical protein
MLLDSGSVQERQREGDEAQERHLGSQGRQFPRESS